MTQLTASLDAFQTPIVFACDSKYVFCTAVAICSIVQSAPIDAPLHFHLLVDEDVSYNDQRRLMSLETLVGGRIVIHVVARERVNDLQSGKIVGRAANFHLLLPQLLPQFDRVLYLDGDVMVRKNIGDLLAHPLGESFLAAVSQYAQGLDCFGRALRIGNWPDRQGSYFNTGVLLLNLRRFREEHIQEQLLDVLHLSQKPLSNYDQDALNMVIGDQFIALHPRWNALPKLPYSEAHLDPAIVHFCQTDRPWLSNKCPYFADYEQLTKVTPWLQDWFQSCPWKNPKHGRWGRLGRLFSRS